MNRILVILVAFVLTLLPGTQGVCQTKSSKSAKTTTTAKRRAASKSAAAKKTQRKPAAKKKAVAKKEVRNPPFTQMLRYADCRTSVLKSRRR